MNEPATPERLYGIWDPRGGALQDGGWLAAIEADLPRSVTPILAFTSLAEADLACGMLAKRHREVSGRECGYRVASLRAGAVEIAAYAGVN